MSFFDRLFGRKKEKLEKENDKSAKTTFSATTMTLDELNKLKVGDTIQLGHQVEEKETFEMKWIEPNDNPYKVRVFDCREFAINMISTTQNEEIAKNFSLTRQSDGKEYIGKFPNNGAKVEVDLNFSSKSLPGFENGIADGVLFKAQTMEQKWDVYKYANFIFYVRSWTGEMVYFSNYIETNTGFKVDLIVLDDDKINENDPYFEFKVVEFLIHSHILNLTVPHPIPANFENDPQKIAAFSFSMFGNRGYFATYD